jgi:BASS family bile acid:Na+ symporter
MTTAALLHLVISISIMLFVASLGLRARWQDTLFLFRSPRLLVPALLSMNVVMPLVAASLVVVFDLPLPVKIALVGLAVSPVPPLLPGKEARAGGDSPYSISLLVTSAVLAIVTVPVTVSVFAGVFHHRGEIAPTKVAAIVLATVLAPLAVGIAVRRLLPALAAKATRPAAILANCLLVVSAVPLLYAAWDAVLDLAGNGTLLVLATMAVIGLAVGHVLGGPEASSRTDLALCTSARHPALALAIAAGSGVETMPALAAVLMYVVVCLVVSVPYVAWRKHRATRLPATTPSAMRTP